MLANTFYSTFIMSNHNMGLNKHSELSLVWWVC